ncbi:hypothetical protein JCM8547_002687 [Rhodosporidiobolus lusitaniae]
MVRLPDELMEQVAEHLEGDRREAKDPKAAQAGLSRLAQTNKHLHGRLSAVLYAQPFLSSATTVNLYFRTFTSMLDPWQRAEAGRYWPPNILRPEHLALTFDRTQSRTVSPTSLQRKSKNRDYEHTLAFLFEAYTLTPIDWSPFYKEPKAVELHSYKEHADVEFDKDVHDEPVEDWVTETCHKNWMLFRMACAIEGWSWPGLNYPSAFLWNNLRCLPSRSPTGTNEYSDDGPPPTFVPPSAWDTHDLFYVEALVQSVTAFELEKPIPPPTQFKMDEQDRVWKEILNNTMRWDGYEGPQLSQLDMGAAEASVVEDEW